MSSTPCAPTETRGGFGQGLEPDKVCPASLPIDVEIALLAMVMVESSDREMLRQACDFLAGVAQSDDAGGAVPPAMPVIEGYSWAARWTESTYQPRLNPTTGLVCLLRTPGSPPAPATAGGGWRKPSCPMAVTTCPRSSSS